MVVAINKLGNGNNEGYVKGYEGLKQPFTKLTVCILMSYGIFMKGEGLTDEFIDIYNILVSYKCNFPKVFCPRLCNFSKFLCCKDTDFP